MKNAKEQQTDSRVKYGGYAAVVTFVVIVGIVLLNLLVQRLGWQIDLTENNVYTLSQQTREIVQGLEDDVTIYYLARQNEETPQIMEALDRYARLSNRISIEIVDAERDPAFAARFDPEGEGLRNGSVIVVSGDKYRAIQAIDLYSIDRRNPRAPQILGLNVERRVTNALIFVAAGRTPIVYQVTGHGEVDLRDFGRFAEQFQNANFELRSVNLLQAPQVPEDGSVLAIIGARTDLTEEEVEKVEAFLDAGGKAFIAVDIVQSTLALPNLNALLEAYGISLPPAIVIDPNANFNNGNPFVLLPQLAESPITEPLADAEFRVLVEQARPVAVAETAPRDVQLASLLQTSADGFYRTNLANSDPNTDDPTDVGGPVPLAVSAIRSDFTAGEEVARLVVMGDVSFLAWVETVNGNLEFLINSFSWLEDQQETISIRPQTTLQFPMNLTGRQTVIFAGIFILVIPLGILITGLVVWLRRRHL